MGKITKQLPAVFDPGDTRGLARLISAVENRDAEGLALMDRIHEARQGGYCLGVTGPPGAGKSTLVDQLIRRFRAEGARVAVLAIDPSSPFSGGAVLGDRVRMQAHAGDPDVYIRSIGSRGAHGGLSRAARDIVRIFDAYGFHWIVVETVGVGQTELAIMEIAATTLVVLVPEAGDTVQTLKAGLLEIADLLVVNKADRDGAEQIAQALRSMVELGRRHVADGAETAETHDAAHRLRAAMPSAVSKQDESGWTIPVLTTVAMRGDGLFELRAAIDRHRAAQASEAGRAKRADLRERECLELCEEELRARLDRAVANEPRCRSVLAAVREGTLNPYRAAVRLVKTIKLVCVMVLLGAMASSARAAESVLLTQEAPIGNILAASLASGRGEELIVADDAAITRYRVSGTAAREIARVPVPRGLTVIHLDAFDHDADGQAELFVSAVNSEGPASLVLVDRPDGTWRDLARDVPWFFRVVDGQLLGQRSRLEKRFAGAVVRLRRAGAGWEAEGSVPLPRGAALYDFTPLKDGAVITVGRRGDLRVWRRDGGSWREAGRAPRRVAGLRGVCLPAETRVSEPTLLAPAQCLALPPLRVAATADAETMAWVVQLPAIGQAVGRVPYWRQWEIVTATWRSGERRLLVERAQAGDGVVTDLALMPDGRSVAALQEGRDDPFLARGVSRVIAFASTR
ncbi:MAG: methylmalonyl Co-A mutase-associated GTPase MeaB [Deltaproteobacteria bacterium]|nr:methylmalonyl Co-A mutase-associated GTPase MeaB [Deltaproteobacteria bacterium]